MFRNHKKFGKEKDVQNGQKNAAGPLGTIAGQISCVVVGEILGLLGSRKLKNV